MREDPPPPEVIQALMRLDVKKLASEDIELVLTWEVHRTDYSTHREVYARFVNRRFMLETPKEFVGPWSS